MFWSLGTLDRTFRLNEWRTKNLKLNNVLSVYMFPTCSKNSVTNTKTFFFKQFFKKIFFFSQFGRNIIPNLFIEKNLHIKKFFK